MTDMTMGHGGPGAPVGRPKLDHETGPTTMILFAGLLGAGLLYVAYSLYVDVQETGVSVTTLLPFLLLFVALLIALGFEFVNGFHDTLSLIHI